MTGAYRRLNATYMFGWVLMQNEKIDEQMKNTETMATNLANNDE